MTTGSAGTGIYGRIQGECGTYYDWRSWRTASYLTFPVLILNLRPFVSRTLTRASDALTGIVCVVGTNAWLTES